MNPITMFLTLVAVLIGLLLLAGRMPVAAAACFVLAVVIFASLKMANAWERFVILRAGRLHGVKGPGLFWIVPILDSITAIIAHHTPPTPSPPQHPPPPHPPPLTPHSAAPLSH